jgi:hypothetical protein
MGTIVCPETSVRNYHYSLCNSPEDGGSQRLLTFLTFSHKPASEPPPTATLPTNTSPDLPQQLTDVHRNGELADHHPSAHEHPGQANSMVKGKGKSKVHQRRGHEGPEREQKFSSILSLTSTLDEGG